jgi:hypothetical protein
MIFPNAKYEIFVCDSSGNIIAPFNIVDFNLFIELSITRAVGEIGACYIRLSGGSNSAAVLTFMSRYGMLKKDTILAIYRTIGNQRTLLLDTIWFVRSIEQFRESTGSFVVKMTAYDTNYLLASRITSAQFGNSPQTAYKNVTNSAIMYDLVQNNIGSNSSIRRLPNFSEGKQLSNYGYLITHYSSKGIAFAYANLLTALQELSQMTQFPVDVNETLYPVYFDTIATSTNQYVFTQFANQRGLDRRFVNANNKAVLLSDTSSQLQDIRLIIDWQEEKTSVISVYQGLSGTTPTISASAPVIDKTRIANSPFAYREVLLQSKTSDLIGEATKYLKEPINYPVYSVYATVQDSPGFLFGVDWGYGDFVTINAFGSIVDVRINGISITITNKAEQIVTQMRVSEAYTQ